MELGQLRLGGSKYALCFRPIPQHHSQSQVEKKALEGLFAEMVAEAYGTVEEPVAPEPVAHASMAIQWSASIPATPINATPRLETAKSMR